MTAYHAKLYANQLSKRGGEGIERLGQSLFDACVDLNPHQVEAALFALRSPVSEGVLLADEVGLGKTIEAGLVLTQLWAEHRRRLLVICPASLRKQWALELEEKFNLPVTVMDAKTYRQEIDEGSLGPFDRKEIVITSIHFASRNCDQVRSMPWDMVVVDEAHKLRNAYRESNQMGQNIRWALEDKRKILLTATPLQNSLLELYGLTTIIDDKIFGDLPSFRTRYINTGADLDDLHQRIKPFCHRTLRRHVLEYINYTERRLITRPFDPSDSEHRLYEAVSEFLQRDGTYAIPHRQKHLTTLIVRKLLASSPYAVAGTLEAMRARLTKLCDQHVDTRDIWQHVVEDEEIEEEILDELLDDDEILTADQSREVQKEPEIDLQQLNSEIKELEEFVRWAHGIGIDTKARTLIKALEVGFKKMAEMDANRKAVLFTESRRTQQYLRDFLEANGYAGQVVTFNGSNNDQESRQIYERWLEKNIDNGRATGSRPVDMRTALIEHFRDHATLLIATEAAAEGINLQFCSLVVNFDLPWNPQRIEQRIGRCHRYGQKHDVVVINFLNKRNAADQRVYELLEHKFSLFSGVFGASDDVLGIIESGVDFEKRILDIYQQCRTPDEIDEAFKQLQQELDEQISQKMEETRKAILEHFDEDVHERLRANLIGTKQQLDRISQFFWKLTKYVLADNARFHDQDLTFELIDSPTDQVRPGHYYLIAKKDDHTMSMMMTVSEFLYRLSHPLGQYVIDQGKSGETPMAEVEFDVTNYPARISVIENLKGQSGWLSLQALTIDSFDTNQYLLFSAFTDSGQTMDQETCEKMFHCDGSVVKEISPNDRDLAHLEAEAQQQIRATINRSMELNSQHFHEAREQLDRWAEDMVLAAERELKQTNEQLKTLKRQARQAQSLEEQRAIQDKIRGLEKKRRQQRQDIFHIEDEIEEKRDRLVDQLEERMTQRSDIESLFVIRWQVL
ncbi:MAG: SNF2-related protein [Candidatus Thiodiazotropha endolucinida]